MRKLATIVTIMPTVIVIATVIISTITGDTITIAIMIMMLIVRRTVKIVSSSNDSMLLRLFGFRRSPGREAGRQSPLLLHVGASVQGHSRMHLLTGDPVDDDMSWILYWGLASVFVSYAGGTTDQMSSCRIDMRVCGRVPRHVHHGSHA